MGGSSAAEICLVGPFAGRADEAAAQGAGGTMLSGTVPALASLDIKGHCMTELSTGWQLDDITYSGGTQDGPRAHVKLSRAEEQVHAEGSGTGLIDAVCHSISRATGVEARVVAFRAYSVGPGSEAVGEVELEVELPGRRVAVRASSTDVVEAAGLALVAALNRYNAKRQAQG
jgi:LeuA allosteric (dimerisation) domain